MTKQLVVDQIFFEQFVRNDYLVLNSFYQEGNNR